MGRTLAILTGLPALLFDWRLILQSLIVRWAINAGALWVAQALLSGIHIHGAAAYLIGAAVLGIANAVLKPLVAILTLPLIIVTLGVSYFLINIAMLALAAWIAPNFSVHGFWTYVGAVLVIWLVNWFGAQVLDEQRRPRELSLRGRL
jgi:putative membrane protein